MNETEKLLAVSGLALLICACGSSDGTGLSEGVGASVCPRATGAEAQGMPTTDRIYGWIEDLVSIGYRRTGTPAGEAAAAYVKCQFESLGLEDVHYETVTSWRWETTRTELRLDGQPVDAFPVAHTFVTPDRPSRFSTGGQGLTAEIVDVGLGTPLEMQLKNVQGKVVLFDLKFLLPPVGFAPFTEFLWDPGLTVVEPPLFIGNPFITTYTTVAEAAMSAGAVGFVGVLADYFDSNKYYNEFYRRTEVTIPGFWVTKKEGERLRAAMAASAAPQATIVFEGSRSEATGRTVVGFLPGRSMETIMVQSHHDSVFYGAVEDGSGTASVLAQAQYFASQRPESRQKTLMFATFDTHFTGYQSHREFVRKYIRDKETPYTIVANVTLEHIGKQGITGDDGALEITELPELRAVIENMGPTLKARMIDSIVAHDLRRTALIGGHVLCPAGLIPTDAAFVCAAGVPTASFIAGPNYLYDAADTLDKVAKEDLVPVANVFAELIEAIDETPSALIGVPIAPDIVCGLLCDPLGED